MSSSFQRRLLATTFFLGAAATAGAAFAQETPDETGQSEEIIVTGSLIRNPNLVGSAPVNVTGEQEIEFRQINVAEDLLRELPGLVAGTGSSVNNGNPGSSFADLRGLDENRNLVLIDAARLTPSDFVGRVDLNNIPVALVERVDIYTGGASTTYGADAVAGVVNFVTRSNFEGFELQASERVTERNDGEYYRVDLVLGANLDGGRGNVALGLGRQVSLAVFQGGDRPFSEFAIDSFDGSSAGSGTTVPSAFDVPGFESPQQMDANGALVDLYQVFNFNPYNIFQTPFDRYNLFATAHYEIADDVEVYARGLHSSNTVESIVAPSGSFNAEVSVPVSNPFLPTAARQTFCAHNDSNPNIAGIQTLTAAECAAAAAATDPDDPNYREFTTNLLRRTTEIGPRISNYGTRMFDYRAGFRGDLDDGKIYWDIFAAYGQSEITQEIQNYVSMSRLRQALRATNATDCLEPENGCVPVDIFGLEGAITPEMGAFLSVKSYSFNRTSLSQGGGTIGGETPWTLGWGDEPVNFALGVEYRAYTAVQTSDLLAQTPGELGGFGGSAAEVDGGYDVFELFGELALPIAQGQPLAEELTLELGARSSKYSIDAPDAEGFETFTYKAGLTWAPIDDVKLRTNLSRAVRAPNVGELFFPRTTLLTNLSLDPCQSRYPTGPGASVPNPNLSNPDFAAICLAQGAPDFALPNIRPPISGQANFTQVGDPNMQPETAETFTVGVILQPRFVKDLSVTLDYYHIEISDAISVPLPGDAISACFGDPDDNGVYTSVDATSASNPACTDIRRNPNTGELNADPANTPGLFLPFRNTGHIETDGIDLAIDWTGDLGFARLALGFVGNYALSSKFQALPTSLDRECVGFYSVNCSLNGSLLPKYQWTQRTTLTFGKVDLSLLWRHISEVEQEPEDILNGNGPGFQGTFPGFGEVDFQHIDAYDYFDFVSRFDVTDTLSLTASVMNLTDNEPPFLGNTMGSTSFNSGNTYPSTYDALGRTYAVEARLRL